MSRVIPAGALADEACALAEQLLGGTGARWDHTRAVAARAVALAPAVEEPQRAVLVAAAWLHDIGYLPALQRSGFHPLDGAWYLQEHHWARHVAGLVAQHSGARFVAAVRGLTPLMAPFDQPDLFSGPVADALTCADQTTGPDGEPMDVEDRLAEMLVRHGPDSPNARCHDRRAPAIRAAVAATCARLHQAA